MSLEYLCNPLHYVDAMRHKHPAILNDWCCTELSRVLDFSGSKGLGQILAGLVDVKQGKTFVKRFTRARPRANSHNGVFGAPLAEEGYCQARQLVDCLKNYITKEGIFRRPGNSERQRRLKDKINSGLAVDLHSEEFTPYDVACVLKSFLGDLPEPLLTDKHFAAHVQAAGLTYAMDEVTCATEELERKYRSRKMFDHINALRYLFLMLPPVNLKILKEILDLLFCISHQHKLNKMTAFNLGVMFAPHILWPRYLTVGDLGDKTLINKLNCGVEFMIIHFHKIFQIPTKMLKRCEQYIKHGRLLDDEKGKPSDAKPQGQDENVTTKRSLVIGAPQKCTVDVKKEQTKTEVALSLLYGSVQEMPSSSKKRKLMKQFARNCNMPGTPTRVKEDLLLRSQLRHSKRPKHVRSKSAGDAVVKHLHPASSVHLKKRLAPNPPATKISNSSTTQGSVSCEMSPLSSHRPRQPAPLTPQQRQQQCSNTPDLTRKRASSQAHIPQSNEQHARVTLSALEKPVPKPRKLKENGEFLSRPCDKRIRTRTAQMHELSSLV